MPSRPGFSFFSHFHKRMRRAAVDFDLLVQRETDVVVERAEIADLVGVARLLVAELVAGEAQHHQALVLVLLPQLLESGVLRGEAAFGGGVDDQHRPCPCSRDSDCSAPSSVFAEKS